MIVTCYTYAIKDRHGIWQAPIIAYDDKSVKASIRKALKGQNSEYDEDPFEGAVLYRVANFDMFSADNPIAEPHVQRVCAISDIMGEQNGQT